MSDKIVEAVARAICIADYHDPDFITGPRMRPGDIVQLEVAIRESTNYRGHAKAAIAAVLDAIAEPSEAMREIGHNAFWSVGGGWLSAHRAMIAALRKEIEDQS